MSTASCACPSAAVGCKAMIRLARLAVVVGSLAAVGAFPLLGAALDLPSDAIEQGIAQVRNVPGRFQVVSAPAGSQASSGADMVSIQATSAPPAAASAVGSEPAGPPPTPR